MLPIKLRYLLQIHDKSDSPFFEIVNLEDIEHAAMSLAPLPEFVSTRWGESFNIYKILSKGVFTGFHDSDGREIYSDDILKQEMTSITFHWHIKWSPQFGGWECVDVKEPKRRQDLYRTLEIANCIVTQKGE